MRRKKEYFPRLPGDPAPVTATVERVLRFSEVDALAIAWHGHYPKFFEEVHTELFRRIGLTYENYAKANVAAPIVQLHTDYYASLRLDERFSVEAALIWNEGARLNVEYTVRGAEGAVAATGYTVQMFAALDTREALWFSPPIWEECRRRWQEGVFDA